MADSAWIAFAIVMTALVFTGVGMWIMWLVSAKFLKMRWLRPLMDEITEHLLENIDFDKLLTTYAREMARQHGRVSGIDKKNIDQAGKFWVEIFMVEGSPLLGVLDLVGARERFVRLARKDPKRAIQVIEFGLRHVTTLLTNPKTVEGIQRLAQLRGTYSALFGDDEPEPEKVPELEAG